MKAKVVVQPKLKGLVFAFKGRVDRSIISLLEGEVSICTNLSDNVRSNVKCNKCLSVALFVNKAARGVKLAALSAAAPAARLRSSGKRAAESTELDEGHRTRTPLRSHSRSRRQTFGSGRAATIKDNIWRRPTSAAVQLQEETHESPDTILHPIQITSDDYI